MDPIRSMTGDALLSDLGQALQRRSQVPIDGRVLGDKGKSAACSVHLRMKYPGYGRGRYFATFAFSSATKSGSM